MAFVRADRLPPADEQQGFLRLAPDLVVEVVSPTDRMTAVLAKAMMWLDAGVRLDRAPRGDRATIGAGQGGTVAIRATAR